MTPSSLGSGILTAVAVAGCDSPPANLSMARSRAVAHEAVTAAVASAGTLLPVKACPENRPSCVRALVVTAHLCLSCRDVGYLVRTLRADPEAIPVILTPAADHAAVVRYLADERAVVPVIPVANSLLAGAREPRLLGYAELGRDGSEERRAVGYDAGAILASIAAADSVR